MTDLLTDLLLLRDTIAATANRCTLAMRAAFDANNAESSIFEAAQADAYGECAKKLDALIAKHGEKT